MLYNYTKDFNTNPIIIILGHLALLDISRFHVKSRFYVDKCDDQFQNLLNKVSQF